MIRRIYAENSPNFLVKRDNYTYTTCMNIDRLIAAGEGQKVEFKERISNIAREFVAFANASGGEVILGITDSGRRVGKDFSNRELAQVQDIARNCDPGIPVTVTLEEPDIIRVLISEGRNKPYQCKDGFFIRRGALSQKLNREELLELVTTESRLRFDEQINRSFNYPEDFSVQYFEQYRSLLKSYPQDLEPQDLLKNIDAVTPQGVFTNAAILFFAKKPQRFFKESHITCIRYSGSDRTNILDRKEINGSLLEQVENAIRFLKRHISVALVLSEKSMRHQEQPEYPFLALREAVVNAVVHRDYFYDASHTYVHVYSNRIEIENPGGLYAGLTVTDLGKKSVRRNRAIASLLQRVGYIEKVGSGFSRMERLLEENGNPPLEVVATNFFLIRFFPRISEAAALNLSGRQKKLYNFIHEQVEVSASQAAHFLSVSSDTARADLNVLLLAKLVEKKGRGKATRYAML